MDPTCHDGVCGKCWGAKYIVIGLLLVANQYWLRLDIWVLIGALLILKGIVKLVKPTCGHCEPSAAAKKGKK